jgi:hypothetical protein
MDKRNDDDGKCKQKQKMKWKRNSWDSWQQKRTQQMETNWDYNYTLHSKQCRARSAVAAANSTGHHRTESRRGLRLAIMLKHASRVTVSKAADLRQGCQISGFSGENFILLFRPDNAGMRTPTCKHES